jgi:hypothetical protein
LVDSRVLSESIAVSTRSRAAAAGKNTNQIGCADQSRSLSKIENRIATAAARGGRGGRGGRISR